MSTMQRAILVLMVLSVSFGCATSKKTTPGNTAVSEPAAAESSMPKQESNLAMDHPAVGEWEYIIRDLPDGDTKGVLAIQQEGDKYMGKIQSNLGSIPLKNLMIENKVLKNASFEAQGYAIDMSGIFEGDAFTGKIRAAGYDFPMSAVRKK